MLILLFNNLAVQIPFDLQYNISVLKWTKKKFCSQILYKICQAPAISFTSKCIEVDSP